MFSSSMKYLLGIAVCGVFAFPLVCNASAAKGEPWKFAVNTPEAFAVQAAAVRKDMGPDGRYREVNAAERAVVEAELEKIEGLLQHRGSAEKLDDKDQVELVNAQENINAVLTKNDGDRLICTLDQRTGTNFKVKTCMTAFQRAERTRKAQQGFQDALMQGSASQSKGD